MTDHLSTLHASSSQDGIVDVGWPSTWRTAIFIDYDNVKLRDGAFLGPGQIIELVRRDLGTTAIVQYCNLYLGMGLPDDPAPVDRGKIHQAYSKGVFPIPIPSFRGCGTDRVKNIADESASVDIVASVFTHPEINSYCIVTCDKDFVPTVRELRKNGKAVRIYYRGEIATVLADEIEWLKGDGFSATVNLETLPYFREIRFGSSHA